jgi:hypothetical protein
MHVIHVVVYGSGINLLSEDIRALKMNTETLLDAFEKVLPEMKAKNTR